MPPVGGRLSVLARAGQNVDAGLKAAESLQMEQGQSLVQYGVALGNRWPTKAPPHGH